MGIGNVLGGVAKGIQIAEQNKILNDQLALRQQGLMNQQKLRQQALGIQVARLQEAKDRQTRMQADKLLGQTVKHIGLVISEAKKAGNDPAKIRETVQQLYPNLDDLGGIVGLDTTGIKQQFDALIGGPSSAETATATGEASAAKKMAEANALEAQGIPRATALNAAGIRNPSDLLASYLIGAGGANFPAPATAAPSSPDIPALPKPLQNKSGIKWSPSKQRFYAPDGTAYNQQGVAVP